MTLHSLTVGPAVRWLLILVAAAALACGGSATPPTFGRAYVALDMGGLSGTGPVQRVEVYVRGTSAKGDLLDLESVAGAAKGRNAYEVSFDRLPVGQGYRFSAKAFDAAAGGNVLFETANYLAYVAGAEQPVADIRAGGLAQVFLLLQPVSPPAGFSNAVPVISAIVASDVAIAPFGKTSLKAYWSDADQANYDGKGSNETMTVRWGATQDGSDVSGGLSGPDGNLTDFTAPGTEGDVTLTFVVDDGRGGRTGANFKVQVATANAISG